MNKVLHDLIRDPFSHGDLELAIFESSPRGEKPADVIEGILFDSLARNAYPIVNGVPVMLENSFTEQFLTRHRAEIDAHPTLSGFSLKQGDQTEWSFSREWDEHFETDCQRTWGYTVQERLEQFLLETQTDRDWLDGKLVMDAGCGNGALADEIASLGAVVVGLDYSSSVMAAQQHRWSLNVHFLQGDLQTPPLAEEYFDLITSIGVLHHTPDTLHSFRSVARLVKPGGKLYVWVYRRPENFLGRYIKVPIYDLARLTTSRLPRRLQEKVVKGYARTVRASHNLRDRENPIALREYVVAAYDDLTPMWRHYHTPIEVSDWFYECGFSAPTLTHWDNPYGFGLVATKDSQIMTPGIHYGEGAKLWDNDRTLLGRLHRD